MAAPSPPECVANIGPREQRKRLVGGIVSFALGLAILAWLELTGTPRAWRLLLLPPFAGAAFGYFQARAKT